MILQVFSRKITGINKMKISSLFIFATVLSLTSLTVFSTFLTNSTISESASSDLAIHRQKLMSPSSLFNSNSSYPLISENFIYKSSFLDRTQPITNEENLSSVYQDHKLKFGINSQYDVSITQISPESMEVNATEMEFTIYFTIEGAFGQDGSALVNLTISNGSDFLITTGLYWNNVQGDNYSLDFTLNQSVLNDIEIGLYNLIIWTRIWTGEYYYSTDSIALFMKDLQVESVIVSPSEFNNKLDTVQSFNITIKVSENWGIGPEPVQSLVDVNATLISTTEVDLIVLLHFTRFHPADNLNGFYKFEVNLTSADAQKFDESSHSIDVTVTNPDGITANKTINTFEAKGTVLLVQLQDISIESNDPLDYSILPFENGDNHVIIRLNINDSIQFTYQVMENSTTPTPKPQTHLLQYQDPNYPDDPFKIITETSTDEGNGTVTLSSSVLSPEEGITFLFYVRGHKTSQELDPTNITIYWDQLIYDFNYSDNSGNIGTNDVPNPKALGVDIGENWSLELNLFYDSDKTAALGSYISYRFSGSWIDVIDGQNGDLEDGTFKIQNKSLFSAVIPFECQIINGSLLSRHQTYFVDKIAGNASFILDITWTYLKIDVTPREIDSRLGTGEATGLNISAVWAHDNSDFNGILKVKGHDKNIFRNVDMTNGEGFWLGLLKTQPGKYRYSIYEITDDPIGITKFTNFTSDQPDDRIVITEIIWDDVYFTFSNDLVNWDVQKFYTNYGYNTTLYCWGRHSYDLAANTSFRGTAVLFDLDNGDDHNITFSGNGIATIQLDRTDAHRGVEFRVMTIITDLNWDVKQILSNEENSIEIVWDKILVTLEAEKTYSHGTWANISVSLEYEVSNQNVDPTQLLYSIDFYNGSTFENVSWRYFLDYSKTTAVHYYNITSVIDLITGINEKDILFNWLDKDMESELGNLSIYWIDNKEPTILEFHFDQKTDLGNGTIFLIVVATDNSETYDGSGIEDYGVVLIDERWDLPYPQIPKYLEIETGVFQFIFAITFDKSFDQWGDQFWFDYGENLSFSVEVTDRGTPHFKGMFDPLNDLALGLNLTSKSEIITYTAVYDLYNPIFTKKDLVNEIVVSYLTLETADISITKLNDGNITISVNVRDERWAGLNSNSVVLNITSLTSSFNEQYFMILKGDIGNPRSELEFYRNVTLPVGQIYHLMVILTDNAGNERITVREVEILDQVAPRIRSIIQEDEPDNRLVEITIEIEENGLGIDYVTVGLNFSKNNIQWYNLSLAGGGVAGSQESAIGSRTQIYSGKINYEFDIEGIFTALSYDIIVNVSDKSGNFKYFSSDELQGVWEQNVRGEVRPLIFHPMILLIIGVVLLIIIIAGVRIASRTEGYDMKRIITESEKISREEILTQMDEFALGVTVNFFDQVQGPVPVIWEPPLLEDQEQVMLDLSDKSFSTLEFVGLDEEERSGTFDFSTGSYECTALGYSFALDNPKARGGKENLTIVLLLRKEWGDNLLIFQDELLEEIRKIHNMIHTQQAPTEIEKQARRLREFVSRLMISFEKLYRPRKIEEIEKVE